MPGKDPGREAGERNYRYQLESVDVLENGAELHSPMNRRFFNWWQSFAPDLPRYEDYLAFPHPELESNMFRIEVTGPERFRVHGTRQHGQENPWRVKSGVGIFRQYPRK